MLSQVGPLVLGTGDVRPDIGSPLAASAPGRPPICLFTPYFKARTAERQEELDECLRRNAECEDIDRIVLLVDDGHVPPVASDKIHIVACAARPTYRQWLELTAPLPADALSILANTDIHFDDTLGRLQHAFREPETFIALSRYDRIDGQLVPHEAPHWSQDTWAVRAGSPILPSLLRMLDVPLGVPRCDNKVAYLFAIHGWKVVNPIRFVRSIHLHQTQQRNYDKKADLTVMGGVAYVHPGPQVDSAAAIDIDVWALGTRAVKSVAVNISLDKWRAQAEGRPFIGATLAASMDTASTTSKPSMAATAAWLDLQSLANTARRRDAESADKTMAAASAASKARTKPSGAESATASSGAMGSSVGPSEPSASPMLARRALARQAPALVAPRPEGTLVYEHARRFRIFRGGEGQWTLRDALRPHWASELEASRAPLRRDGTLAAEGAAAFIDPVFDTYPILVGERPVHAQDVHFWQYPAATERQALYNHAGGVAGQNVDTAVGVIHSYLGLPWATYIDKKLLPPEISTWIKPRVAGFRSLAQQAGLQLAVHTVCQQIHWRRFVEHFRALGVTDLHLSHGEQGAQAEVGGAAGLRLHSWPLIAVNVEDEARRVGLEFDRPLAQRRYLASFIGAHMPHYRSDVRLRLLQAARDSGRSDVLVDLGSEWHFNKIVYVEQVASKKLTDADRQAHDSSTLRYNQVLSDSVFSLCPEGAGPNTLRVWESLAVGAIPVIMADRWILPPSRGSEPALADCCVMWPSADLRGLFDMLSRIPSRQRETMSSTARDCYQAMRRRQCWT